MSNGEGNILVLEETKSTDHGIILFIGREPNNTLGTDSRIDGYGHQWRDGRLGDVQFWNNSYSLCGKITGYHCGALKLLCAKGAGCSPIAYADLSPLSLDKATSSYRKIKLRSAVAEDDYRAHIADIFSHEQFIKRVKLAVCAGHKGAGLDKGIPLLERHLEQASIPYCHIDSLNSTQVTIDHRVQQMGDKAGIVSDVFDDFFQRYLPADRQVG